MKIDVFPSVVSGTITPPASKSMLHRSIISAALSKGTSRINNVVYSEDVLATINAFKSIGVDIRTEPNYLVIQSKGLGDFKHNLEVDCNESGSTLRFLIPVLSNSNKVHFKGKSGLLKRPMTIYEDIFKSQNLKYEKTDLSIITQGKIKSGNFRIRGDISSQFISGLMFILPTLDGDSTIEITGNLESANYVALTISVLKLFSIIITTSENVFSIKGNQTYKSTEINTEIDFSQLAFYAVLGTINNSIKIANISFDSLQPDKYIFDIIQDMGGYISKELNTAVFSHSKTKGIAIDIGQYPDLAPILGVLGALSTEKTEILNAKRLIIKESNRLLSTYNMLKNFGVNVNMGIDFLEIFGPNNLTGCEVDSYNDHRIAMAAAIAATVADSKVTINNAEAINKSYPNFYKDLQSLGVKIHFRS